MKRHDVRELGMDRSVSRRDFLNGVGVALTGTLLPPSSVEAFRLLQESEYYPPTRTGMRGTWRSRVFWTSTGKTTCR